MNPSPKDITSNSEKNLVKPQPPANQSSSKPFNNGSPRRDNAPRNPRSHPRTSSSDSQGGREKRSNHNLPANLTHSASSSPHDPSLDDALASKKGKSLNHLLNFSFPEREKGLPQAPRRRTRAPVYNKERYLHASFRFLVADTEQYIANLADPDLSVEWENIEQVIVSNPQDQSCPICLSAPIAPRITRCGHVFCHVCILHYLALGENKWRRCPICYESVYQKDLRSVKINQTVPRAEGDTIRMVLMQKTKKSYVAWPRATWNPSVMNMLPAPTDPSGATFSKLILATLPELQQIYTTDQLQLEEQLQEAHSSRDSDSVPFIEQALVSVQEKLESLTSNPLAAVSEQLRALSQKYREKEAAVVEAYHPPVQSLLQSRSSSQTYLQEYESAFTDDESEERSGGENGSQKHGSASTGSADDSRSRHSLSDSDLSDLEQSLSDTAIRPKTGAQRGSPPTAASASASPSPSPARKNAGLVEDQLASSSYVYFYQAEDGQPIFAQQFILKALLADRGSLENLPEAIEAKILELEELSQTQESRKRFKNTAHLPLTSEFSFCELDLKTGSLISSETYKEFQSEIKSREQKRKTRAWKEVKESKKKEKHNLNDQHRFQRFLESYNESFPVMDSSLQEDSFPLISSSTTSEAKASEAKFSTSPRGNYAGIVKGASAAPDKPIFSDLDFAATLSSSSSSKGKNRNAPAASDFPTLATATTRSAPPPSAWGASASSKPQPSTAAEPALPKLNPNAASFTPGATLASAPPSFSSQPTISKDAAAVEEDATLFPGGGAATSGQSGGGGKKGGKAKKTLLMSTASHQRRY